jgi:hypothetical protein
VFGGGVVIVAVVLLGSAFTAALAYNVAARADLGVLKALYDVGTVLGILTGPPAAVLIGAASLVVLRHGALPAWTGWLGAIVAIANATSTVAIFSTTGVLSPTGPIGFVTFGVTMIWLAVTSGTLIARIGGSVSK